MRTLDEKVDRLDGRLERLDDRLDSIDKTLIRQEAHLQEHMRRTEAAEAAIDLIRTDMRPLTAHVNRVEGGLKLIGISTTLISLVAGAISLLKVLF